jgi:hypothetical protein
MRSRADVRMETPQRYLGQLCKHFAHRIPVEQHESTGRIAFTFGTCRLAAEPEALVMQAEAADLERLAQVQQVIESHLLRFAFRQPPSVVWQPVAG